MILAVVLPVLREMNPLRVIFLFALAAFAAASYKYIDVSFYKANSNCNHDIKSPQSNVTYVTNQCYNGYMYDCDEYGGITYMIYDEVHCADLYPDSYGLPSFFCMSPVYAYSQYDTYFYCYN